MIIPALNHVVWNFCNLDTGSTRHAASCPAPRLGEHTEALLRGPGYDGARIQALKDSKVI